MIHELGERWRRVTVQLHELPKIFVSYSPSNFRHFCLVVFQEKPEFFLHHQNHERESKLVFFAANTREKRKRKTFFFLSPPSFPTLDRVTRKNEREKRNPAVFAGVSNFGIVVLDLWVFFFLSTFVLSSISGRMETPS